MGRSKRGHERRLEECWSWDKLSAQRHLRHPNVYAPFRILVTPNHQYLPKLFLSSSQDQVRVDRVVRGLQPCSELVTMPRKVEARSGLHRCRVPEDCHRSCIGKPPGVGYREVHWMRGELAGQYCACASWEEPFGGSPAVGPRRLALRSVGCA